MEEKIVFKPRPSLGWISLLAMGILLSVVSLANVAINPVLAVLFAPLGIFFFLLTFWWPTMRYELDRDALTLRYGPVINFRIPLDSIQSMRRANLALSLWSSFRFPGAALFKVAYGDVGSVYMCATAALHEIFLIQTERGLVGITPADEKRLADEIQARMGR